MPLPSSLVGESPVPLGTQQEVISQFQLSEAKVDICGGNTTRYPCEAVKALSSPDAIPIWGGLALIFVFMMYKLFTDH